MTPAGDASLVEGVVSTTLSTGFYPIRFWTSDDGVWTALPSWRRRCGICLSVGMSRGGPRASSSLLRCVGGVRGGE